MKNKLDFLNRNMFLATLLFIVFSLNFNIISQNSKIDSLKLALSESKIDSNNVKILKQLSNIANKTDKDLAIDYLIQSLKFEHDKQKRAVIFNNIGIYHWQNGSYIETIDYYKQALTLFTEFQDSIWLGRVYNNLASAYWGLGNSNDALENYHKGLKIRKKIKDFKGVALVLNNIGLIYQDWELYDEALKWHSEALDISLRINDFGAISYSYSNFGKCYSFKKYYEKALQYYQLGYEAILKKEEESRSLSFFFTQIGDVYNKMKDYKNALLYFTKALNEAKRINNDNRIATSEYHLGQNYFEINKIDSASQYINLSYERSLQNGYIALIRDNKFMLSKIEERKGNISKAFEYFKSASALKDSTFNKEKIQKFISLQIKNHTEQQTQENLILRKNNEIQKLTIMDQKHIGGVLIVCGIFALIILVLISRSRISFKKLNKKLIKSEKDLLELNANKDTFFSIISHDLKGPFNGILGICEMLDEDFDDLRQDEIKELIKIIKNSTSNVYELLDGLLKWAQTQTGRMEYYFENIDIHKNITKIIEILTTTATNKNIELKSNVTENTPVFADSKAISTVIRNLVSNAIKFTESGGKIEIDAKKMNDEVIISISDTGIGMSQDNISKLFRIETHKTTLGTNDEIGTGLGLILCKELIEKHGGNIWIESEIGKGSKFNFSLPNKSNFN